MYLYAFACVGDMIRGGGNGRSERVRRGGTRYWACICSTDNRVYRKGWRDVLWLYIMSIEELEGMGRGELKATIGP